jgi:hypothetical protein
MVAMIRLCQNQKIKHATGLVKHGKDIIEWRSLTRTHTNI